MASRRILTAGAATGACAFMGWVGYRWLRKQPTMLGALVRRPGDVGEILPTSTYTCRRMVQLALDGAPSGPVVELGAGTGKSTAEILKLCGHRHVYTCEIDDLLRAVLTARFGGDPRVTIFADAREAERHLNGQQPAAWISYLPFTSLPAEVTAEILQMIQRIGGRLVLIQYTGLREGDLRGQLGDTFRWIRSWRNVPPGRLYLFEVGDQERESHVHA
jgi:phospholipid N-methyltransferase